MLIENPDAFKTWLTAVLEPLCDADPTALARYVYALVKKDKPIDDLRVGMVDQLDVFLQNETKPFVELLFKSLDSHEYLNSASATQPPSDTKASVSPSIADKPERIPLENHEHNNVGISTPLDDLAKDDLNDLPRNDRKELSTKDKDSDIRSRHNSDNLKRDISAKQRIVLNRTTKFVPAIVPKEKPAYATEQTLVKVIPDLLEDSLNEQLPIRSNKQNRKSDSDKEDRRRRQRSRSRSWDRTRRPPGANRLTWRNRSPPTQQNRYERRRSRSGSPPVRAPRYRNRSPPPGSDLDAVLLNRSRSRSRERLMSPGPNRMDRGSRERERDRQSRTRDRADRSDRDRERLDRDREREDRPGRGRDSGAATPTQDSNPGDSSTQPRGTTTLAGIFGPSQKKRCRDFDEKGYCLRGDQCQFDHGVDPLVLEEPTSITQLYMKNQPVLPLPMTRPPPRLPAPGCVEYNPLAPDIWSRGGIGMYTAPPPPYFPFINVPPHGHQPVQRELIPVPIAISENMPPINNGITHLGSMSIRPPLIPGAPLAPAIPANNHSVPPPMHPMKKKPFDFNRLGPNRHHVPKIPGGNCSLELKKVPRGLNDIMHLNNHFSKFGKIINIQVNYEEEPESALITFSSHTEANIAYKSTEAVLNNRFIKVFWHNSEQSKQENVPPVMRISAKDRLNPGLNNHTTNNNNNNGNHASYNKVLINKDNMKLVNTAQSDVKQPTNLQKTEANNVVVENEKNGDDSTALLANEPTPAPPVDGTIRPDVPASIELAAMIRRRGEGAAKLVKDLRQRSQQLLDKQLQQQKMLLQHLESKTNTEGQRESLLATIKTVQISIEKTKKDLVSNPKSLISQPEDNYVVNSMQNMSLASLNCSASPTSKKAAFGNLKPKVPKSKEETQKEILDAELDLFTKQQEGQDVSELQKRVTELKRQQLSIKPTPPARRPSAHRVSTRGRFTKAAAGAKSGMFVNQSVDHRPRSFLVSGYEADELDQLVQHFTQFGVIVENISDPTTPSLWLQFKSRKIAEQAATKGRQFNDRTLTVTWQPKMMNPLAPQSQTEKASAGDGAAPNDTNYFPSSPVYSLSKMASEAVCPLSPVYMDNDMYSFPDSEDEEGKEYERSWRR